MGDKTDSDDEFLIGSGVIRGNDRRKIARHAWEQEVRDEKGRRRFHGAFTGGFSAGYFNTVGSKEGWTPSTFRSSRSAKASSMEQRVEDYMDEEDLQDRRILTANDGFRQEDSSQILEQRKKIAVAAILPDDMVLVRPLSMGEQLLRALGWRPKSNADLDLQTQRDKSCSGSKRDRIGLGYAPSPAERAEMERAQAAREEAALLRAGARSSSTTNQSSSSTAASSLPRGTAFGISVLEEEDDIDVYAETAPETTHIDDEAGDEPLSSSVPQRQARCQHDLSMFVLSDIKATLPEFPPIAVPRTFRPFHEWGEGSDASRNVQRTTNPAERGRALGVGNALNAKFVSGAASSSSSQKPTIVDATMRLPFENDPEKQRRFVAWLSNNPAGGPGGALEPLLQALQARGSSSVDEVAGAYVSRDDLIEFRRTAEVYSAAVCEQEATRSGAAASGSDSATAGGRESRSLTAIGSSRRDESQWRPHRLLCRRMNVADPFEGIPEEQSRVQVRSWDTRVAMTMEDLAGAAPRTVAVTEARAPPPLPPSERRADVVAERPAPELFHAVFGDSSDDEES